MEKFLEKLTDKIITKEDLISFLDQIEIAKSFLFQRPEISLSEKLKGKVSESFRKEIANLEEKEKYLSVAEFSEFFDLLKKNLLKIPIVKLEIAFEPRENFISEINEWFKKNLGKKVILDIFVNPKIVGGAKIEYQGKWKNYSLAKKIEKIHE
jgi:F0F1-type ATP synthase delta subunit